MSVVPCDFVILFYLTVVVMVLWFWQAIALFFPQEFYLNSLDQIYLCKSVPLVLLLCVSCLDF